MTPGRLAYIGGDHQLHTVLADGTQASQLTLSLASNPLLVWGQPGVPATAYSWPTWSPDGQRLACFSYGVGEDTAAPAAIHVIEADGLREYKLATFRGALPIYAAWQPDGAGLAVLAQDGQDLELSYGRLDDLGRLRSMDQGSPLFFAWGPAGRKLVIHTGPSRPGGSGRVVVRDSLGVLPDESLPQSPGDYCNPVVVGHRLVHVERTGSVNRLVSTDLVGADARPLLEFAGLGAVIAAPGAGGVIFSAAPRGDGTPYRGATLVDLDTGEKKRLTDDDCLAFAWSEPGRQLLYAQVGDDPGLLAWHSVRPGEVPVELVRCWPTKEMLFALHFFEQFATTHRFVSPDGRNLVFAGHRSSEGPGSGPPGIYVMDLRTEDPPRRVGDGTFACFAPIDGV